MQKRIAFISDIHSNFTALNAVIKDIEKRNVDYIVCLGDIIGKGPRPQECTNLIKEKCKYVIKGNLEVSVLKLETKEHGIWNRKALSEENKRYLDSLPLELELNIGEIKIKCIHAFSKSGYMKDVIRVTEEDNIEEIGNLNYDILIYADIHHQYVKKYGKTYVFNTGSVGLPLIFEHNQRKNLNVDAEYLILAIEEQRINYDFILVPYDKKEEIEYTRKTNMPHKNKYITEITTGIVGKYDD